VSTVAYAERLRNERARQGGLPQAARPFLISTVVVAAAAAFAASLAQPGPIRWIDFALLIVGGAVAQTLAVHTPRNQVFHTGLAFTVAAAVLLPPAALVAVCVGQHLPDWLRQRYPWYIQTFNMANFTFGALAAWAVRRAAGGLGLDTGLPGTTGVVMAASAAAVFVLVNHAMLARMLKLARGHARPATGLFAIDSLITDLVLGGIGVGVALALVEEPAAAPIAALPLILIHRVLVVPTLRALAVKDHKTGLLNTRGLEEAAGEELSRARRFSRPMSLLMVDVDDLRGLNNRHGHLVGDAALVAVADAFHAELREYDLCGRFGGDEFVVVFPEVGMGEALAAARRVESRVRDARLTGAKGESIAFTVSVGTATRLDGDRTLDDLIGRADAAMYEAKRGDAR
jgi:diguanylate cyclase (GGDEF)-like protein